MAYSTNDLGGARRRPSGCGCGCLNSVGGRWRWGCGAVDNDGPQVRAIGRWEDDAPLRSSEGARRASGMFTAMLPMAVAPNGIIPLVGGPCGCAGPEFTVNSGLITLEAPGRYLATCDLRVPEGVDLASTISLTVNDAPQPSALIIAGCAGPAAYSAQALFDVCGCATLALRTSEAISATQTSPQPLFTLSLVKLD